MLVYTTLRLPKTNQWYDIVKLFDATFWKNGHSIVHFQEIVTQFYVSIEWIAKTICQMVTKNNLVHFTVYKAVKNTASKAIKKLTNYDKIGLNQKWKD